MNYLLRLPLAVIFLLSLVPLLGINNDSLKAVSYRALSLTALEANKADSATSYLQQALHYYQKSNDLVNWINTNKDFGKQYRDHLRNPEMAVLYLEAATERRLWRNPETPEEWDALGWLHVNLAYTYNYAFEDHKKARLNYQKAIDILVTRLKVES